MPSDPTEATRFDHEYERTRGAYSETWLGREEIAELARRVEAELERLQECWWEQKRDFTNFEQWLGSYLYGNGFQGLPDHIDDVRFVVWFD